MKLPEQITIGHQTYKILTKDKEWMSDANKYGYLSFSENTIAVVNKDMDNNHIVNTLLHEILHGIFREYNLITDMEEHIVTCVTNGLCQVFRDNPELISLLRKLK